MTLCCVVPSAVEWLLPALEMPPNIKGSEGKKVAGVGKGHVER